MPDSLRVALADASVLSYRLLYFERHHDGEFAPPSSYPAQAIVAASTHDLPTLTGWWEGRDLAVRAELGLFPNDQAKHDAHEERVRATALVSCVRWRASSCCRPESWKIRSRRRR